MSHNLIDNQFGQNDEIFLSKNCKYGVSTSIYVVLHCSRAIIFVIFVVL